MHNYMAKLKKNIFICISFIALFIALVLPFTLTTSYSVSEGGKKLDSAPVMITPDFASIEDVNQKKQAFFDYIRQGLDLENHRILNEREHLLEFNLHSASSEDLSYAKRLGRLYSYNVPASGVDQAWIDEMLLRVNVLPEALVLVQAANESAWGTSRFATKGNNFFGQWCYQEGCGIIPLQRPSGSTHEVASFQSTQESIHRYFMNVNRNRAYLELRQIRAELEGQGTDLLSSAAAVSLTNGLLRYSERGEDYVNDLQAMIRHNQSFWIQ